MKKSFLFYLIFLPLAGFPLSNLPLPAAVRLALIKAGKNKGELEKVISHYKKTGEPQKLKAAYFLIENMDAHNSSGYYWEDRSGKRVPYNELDYPTFEKAVTAFQKIKAINPGLHPHTTKDQDINNLKAGYLIQNIDYAFHQWKSDSRYKNIPFNDFCEYLLPYRVSSEPLQPWREVYNKQFSWFKDKYRSGGLVNSLSFISADFRNWFTNTYSIENSREPLPRLGGLQLLLRKKGPCEDIADLVVFTMRSQGIPAAVNYIPYWATATSSHFFNTIFDEHMKPVQVDVAGNPPVHNTLAREPSKVLRITYSKQHETIAENEKITNIPPGFMRNSCYIDVSDQFWHTSNISCKLFETGVKFKHAFVCVFNGMGWRPTWWGTIKNNNTTFKNMPQGAIFLPVYFTAGQMKPAGYPIAHGYNHELILVPDTIHKRSVIIREEDKYLAFRTGKSYELFYWNNSWKTLGKRRALFNTHELLFTNVPGNALYLLIPEYSEKKERPFMILDNGKIKWW